MWPRIAGSRPDRSLASPDRLFEDRVTSRIAPARIRLECPALNYQTKRSRVYVGYGRSMRIVWAALAVLPFAVVLLGMVTGRVQARSCCAVPPEDDARLRAAADDTQ